MKKFFGCILTIALLISLVGCNKIVVGEDPIDEEVVEEETPVDEVPDEESESPILIDNAEEVHLYESLATTTDGEYIRVSLKEFSFTDTESHVYLEFENMSDVDLGLDAIILIDEEDIGAGFVGSVKAGEYDIIEAMPDDFIKPDSNSMFLDLYVFISDDEGGAYFFPLELYYAKDGSERVLEKGSEYDPVPFGEEEDPRYDLPDLYELEVADGVTVTLKQFEFRDDSSDVVARIDNHTDTAIGIAFHDWIADGEPVYETAHFMIPAHMTYVANIIRPSFAQQGTHKVETEVYAYSLDEDFNTDKELGNAYFEYSE